MSSRLPNINVAFTGHVDHGKSTLIGKLLYQNDKITDHEYEQYRQETEKHGNKQSELAFVSDNRLEERERGLSIKPSYNHLSSDVYNYTLIDCPGHRNYIGNMIKGVTQCDASVLTVSAPEGVQTLTKEHALLSQVMGKGEVLVAIAKMDAVGYDKSRFESVRKEIESLFEKLPMGSDEPLVVPVSGLEGRNVTTNDEGIPWFDGLSLLEALDTLPVPSEHEEKSLRLPIDEKYTMTGIGTTVAGTIQSGELRRDDDIVFEPGGTKCTVRSIEMHNDKIGHAQSRDNVGVNIAGIHSVNVTTGDVCGPVDDPPSTAREIGGTIQVVNHSPTIEPGVKVTLHIHSTSTPCKITSVSSSNQTDQAGKLSVGERGDVELRTPEPIALETSGAVPALRRFVLRDNNRTIAYGDVVEIR